MITTHPLSRKTLLAKGRLKGLLAILGAACFAGSASVSADQGEEVQTAYVALNFFTIEADSAEREQCRDSLGQALADRGLQAEVLLEPDYHPGMLMFCVQADDPRAIPYTDILKEHSCVDAAGVLPSALCDR